MSDPTFNRDEVIRHLLFRIRKLEKVQEAAWAIKEDGRPPGRGKEVNGAETILVLHGHWLRLLDAMNNADDPPGRSAP